MISAHCLDMPKNDERIEIVPKSLKWDPIHCKEVPDHARTGARIGHLQLIAPAKPQDFYWTWYSDCIVTVKVKQAILDAKLTGCEFQPTKVLGHNGLELWELRLLGWGGMAPRTPGIHLLERCPTCRYLHYSCWADASQIVDWNQWDGSDFFMVWPLPRYIFISEKALAFFESNRFSGLKIARATEFNCESGLSPGRLSEWMPQERAYMLGRRLDIA